MPTLVIGFEAADQTVSASSSVISAALDHLDREDVVSEFLRIEKGSVADMHQRQTQQLVQLIFQHKPGLLLFVGQAAGRSKAMLERLGINYFIDQRIVDEAPAAYWQSLPELESLVSEAKAQGLAVEISNFAGTNMTNHALYSALHLAATEQLPLKAGLLHLPLLDTQCIDELKDQPSITLDQASQCLAILLARLAGSDQPSE